MSANYYKTLGRFNLCGTEKEWQVVLRTDAGSISALWAEDDEPDVADCMPSDVLELIDARINRPGFWSSSKGGKNATVAKMRESIDAADREWLTARVEAARKSLARWESQLEAAIAKATGEQL